MITLVVITVLNIFGVRLVAIINNTGVLFEILGMVVFAFVLALFHHHQSARRDLPHRRHEPDRGDVPRRDVHVPVRDLRVRHRRHARGGDEEPAHARRRRPCIASVIGAFVIGADLPVRDAARDPEHARRDQGLLRARRRSSTRTSATPSRPCSCSSSPPRSSSAASRSDLDGPALLRDGARRHAPGVAAAEPRCSPRLHTPIGRASRSVSLAFIPMHPVRGRGDHRDRSDRDDLPQLPDREHRAAARPAARLAEGESALLARTLGPSD